MKKRLLYLIFPLITLLLEALPYGAVCNFARPATDGSIGHFRELYSYFDMIPFGYANFTPLITAMISCIILLLTAIYCITGKQNWAIYTKNTLLICAVISLGPLLLGIQYFSVVGALITVSLAAQWLFLHVKARSSQTEEPQ